MLGESPSPAPGGDGLGSAPSSPAPKLPPKSKRSEKFRSSPYAGTSPSALPPSIPSNPSSFIRSMSISSPSSAQPLPKSEALASGALAAMPAAAAAGAGLSIAVLPAQTSILVVWWRGSLSLILSASLCPDRSRTHCVKGFDCRSPTDGDARARARCPTSGREAFNRHPRRPGVVNARDPDLGARLPSARLWITFLRLSEV
mmetsp:Transcript_3215/g.9751  ORF Transcript_3215/g.9751 Transcript_3215/m.9751 type:complete len:201 (+) Transcript_3215:1358-1960(+)